MSSPERVGGAADPADLPEGESFSSEAFAQPTAIAATSWRVLSKVSMTPAKPLPTSISGLPRSGRSATAVIIPIALVLQFISGVYLSFSLLPTPLTRARSVLSRVRVWVRTPGERCAGAPLCAWRRSS